MTVSETAFDTAGLRDSPDNSVHHTLREIRRYLGLTTRELLLLRGAITDQSRPVDEELSGVPSPLSLHADFDTVDEMITAIVVSTPLNLASSSFEGSVTSPGALATIATSGVLPAGEYTVSVVANLAGTVTQGTDNNNFQLVAGGAVVATLDNEIIAGDQYFGPFTVILTTPGTILVRTIGAGTAGSIYSVTETDQTQGEVTLQLGTRTFNLPPGVVTLAPLRMLLSKTDQRILTWTQGGNGALEIMGYAAGDAG